MAELLQQQSDTTEMMYLCFCESGNFDVELDGIQHHVGPWSMLIIQPKVQAKCVRQSPRFDFAAFGVTRDFFDSVMITFFRQEPQWWSKRDYMLSHPVVELNEKQRELAVCYRQLYKAYLTDEQSEYRKKIIQTAAVATAYEVLAYLEQQLSNIEEAEEYVERKDYIFKQFLDLLHSETPIHRKVQWYADRLHLTPKYLSAVCKEVSGKTAMQWIHSVLQDEIKRLLTTSEMSVKEIVYRLDFPDLSFFGRYVRKNFGMSPNQYRNKHHT